MMNDSFLKLDWPTPERVVAYITTRQGVVSGAPYTSFNLSSYVGDDMQAVEDNRRQLAALSDLPAHTPWLRQVHGRQVIAAEDASDVSVADAIYTRMVGHTCLILTADCLPNNGVNPLDLSMGI